MEFPFQIQSLEQYHRDYKESIENPENFWATVAENFVWKKKWDKVLDYNFIEPKIEWFINAKLNITENCLDRHLIDKANQPAIIWEPNNPNLPNRILTYNDLYHQVNAFAKVLLNNGVTKGDRVCIYMGMIPELAIAILACARIGAVHSVIFGGFSANSVADRINDAKAKLVITADGSFRGEKSIPLKSVIDDALKSCQSVEKVIVVQHTKINIEIIKNRDLYWHHEMAKVEANKFIEPEVMDAEDMLFILYTSGSTGKPKGVVHSCAGYMVWATYTFVNVFHYQPKQVHFCTADIGWITGHSYLLYGPLCAGATTMMFEGIPTYPDSGRFWGIVEKYNVDIFYTAPTAIRSLMGCEEEIINSKNLSSLKVLGTVGEPINEEAWNWYHKNIGKENCDIVDTWWQTETGGIMISNLAGVTPQKPTFATLPLPGILPVLVNETGEIINNKPTKGNLCIAKPWPGMLRTTYGDHKRCQETYFGMYPNLYFTGDGASIDEFGNYKITGRVDDVLNVSGHRLGTAEIENAINLNKNIVESAVVGYPHPLKGIGIFAFVVPKHQNYNEKDLKAEIISSIVKEISAIAKPDEILIVPGLPKTRSGKIMRRILRKIAEKSLDNLGDTSTLIDPAIVETIIHLSNSKE